MKVFIGISDPDNSGYVDVYSGTAPDIFTGLRKVRDWLNNQPLGELGPYTLTDLGERKIQIIKIFRRVSGLGLKDAKTLVESAPIDISEYVEQVENPEAFLTELEMAGATVTRGYSVNMSVDNTD